MCYRVWMNSFIDYQNVHLHWNVLSCLNEFVHRLSKRSITLIYIKSYNILNIILWIALLSTITICSKMVQVTIQIIYFMQNSVHFCIFGRTEAQFTKNFQHEPSPAEFQLSTSSRSSAHHAGFSTCCHVLKCKHIPRCWICKDVLNFMGTMRSAELSRYWLVLNSAGDDSCWKSLQISLWTPTHSSGSKGGGGPAPCLC